MPGSTPFRRPFVSSALCAAPLLCAALLNSAIPASAQVFIVQPQHIEQHYSQIDPTNVKLPAEPLTTIGREQLYRFMQSEQGFAMRPLPVGNVTLQANGPMEPGGEKYIDELHMKGISAKPGDRVVVTNIKVRDNSIVIDLNNGPEHKHKYLRHVSVGMDPTASNPIVPDDGTPPTGSRITLVFDRHVPDLSGEQIEALLKPMIDFGVRSPAEAYAESLPDFLRKAILEHRVLVGMDHDMVLYAKGQPVRKVREPDDHGKMMEIWIYGEAPQPVEFVRFQGNTVVRTEVAKVGEPMVVQTANEMGDYRAPVVAANEHQVQLGDPTAADQTEENAPKAPPSLRQPGEKLPTDDDKDHPVLQPVKFPPGMQRPGDPGYSPTVSAQPQPATGSAPASTQPSSSSGTQPSGSNTQQKTGSGSAQPSSTSGCGTKAPAQPPANAPAPSSTPSQQCVAPSH
ncbi:MAG: hypothetical protein WA294_14625 [Acidobacteriaceae bacterium]